MTSFSQLLLPFCLGVANVIAEDLLLLFFSMCILPSLHIGWHIVFFFLPFLFFFFQMVAFQFI